MHHSATRSIILALMSLALAFTAAAQQPAAAPAPAPAPASAVSMPMPKHDSAGMCAMMDAKSCSMMKEHMAQGCPMMAGMMHPAGPMGAAELAKPETAQQLAAFVRNFYDALIAKGFSKADALKIVTEIGIPSVSAAPMAHPAHGAM